MQRECLRAVDSSAKACLVAFQTETAITGMATHLLSSKLGDLVRVGSSASATRRPFLEGSIIARGRTTRPQGQPLGTSKLWRRIHHSSLVLRRTTSRTSHCKHLCVDQGQNLEDKPVTRSIQASCNTSATSLPFWRLSHWQAQHQVRYPR